MKYKIKTVDCQLEIKVKASFSESFDESELGKFSRIFIRGFLKPKVIRKSLVEYTGPVGVSLYDRLKKPITKRDFLFVIEQVIIAIQNVRNNGLDDNNLILDIHYVFINEVTKEIQMIYLPIVGKKQTNNISDFIESIVYSVKPADEKDQDYVSRFIYAFKAIYPFDLDQVEQIIRSEDRSVVNTIRKQRLTQSGFMTDKRKDYYEHYDRQNDDDDEATSLLEEDSDYDEPTGLLQENDDEATGLLMDDSDDDEATGLLVEDDDEATGLLVEDEEATGLLVEDEPEIVYPTLFRILTNETISINKPVFRIGKERSYVDYFVSNNIAVSRSHADIITRGNQYYIKDLNSKNHTYVNNVSIPVQTEVEIFNGDHIRLGNEEFIFNNQGS
ncbi:MAG: FHA domain-containing protein [Bulleidia sp.]